MRTEMNNGLDSLRTEMNNGLDSLRTEIREVETNLRTEMREGDESLRQDIRALGTRMDIQDQKMLGISARLDTLIDRSYSTELHPLP